MMSRTRISRARILEREREGGEEEGKMKGGKKIAIYRMSRANTSGKQVCITHKLTTHRTVMDSTPLRIRNRALLWERRIAIQISTVLVPYCSYNLLLQVG